MAPLGAAADRAAARKGPAASTGAGGGSGGAVRPMVGAEGEMGGKARRRPPAVGDDPDRSLGGIGHIEVAGVVEGSRSEKRRVVADARLASVGGRDDELTRG